MKEKDIERLSKKFGSSFKTSPVDRLLYSYDATRLKEESWTPEGVFIPPDSSLLQEFLRESYDSGLRFPMIPRGAGSGLAGGSLPVKGGVVVSFEMMNRIVDVDEKNLTATVEPGVVTGEFQKVVEGMGLFYPPDPASLDFCTIGGNIATCAGGPRAVKYGVTRDYILGLEVMTWDGAVIKTGVKTMKGVTGYDLTRLFVGSEGTLGFIIRAYIRLIPLNPLKKTLLLIFEKMEDAGMTVSKIIDEKIIPCRLEIMDDVTVRAVRDYGRPEFPDGAKALLLVEVDGRDEETLRREVEAIERVSSCFHADPMIPSSREAEEALWEARRAISPALYKMAPFKINEDIVVRRSDLAFALKRIGEISRGYGIMNANYGHAGDGNIHMNLLIDARKEDEFSRAKKAVREILEFVVGIGGTISGEHGIGLAKARFLPLEVGEREIELMKGLKKVFDPYSLMNPGKIFPSQV